MGSVFVAGSMNIKGLAPEIQARIDNMLSSHLAIVVGDADGADAAVQRYLAKVSARQVTVYCSGASPRNNIGNWPVKPVTSPHEPGSRAFHTAKDIEMAAIADYGLMIWDARSTGTLSNIIELIGRGKASLVFLNKRKEFWKIANIADLEKLVNKFMSEGARRLAETKIRLGVRIESLKHEQAKMF